MSPCRVCLEAVEEGDGVKDICLCKDAAFHKDCFATWLNHKQDKKHCEVCKGEYQFPPAISFRARAGAFLATFLYAEAAFVIAITSDSEQAVNYFILGCIATICPFYLVCLTLLMYVADKRSPKEILSILQGSSSKYIQLQLH